MRPFFFLLVASFVAAAALATGCSGDSSGDSGGGGGGSGDLAFHGEVPALAGFAYDTGELPAAGPVQIQLTFGVGGSIKVDEGGHVADGKVAGSPQTGKLHVDAHFTLKGHAKAKTAIKSYDGDVPGLTNVDIAATGDATFDPFLLDGGQTAQATAPIAPTKLPDIPLGSVPGHLELTVVAGSQLVTSYAGTCMTVSGGNVALTGTATTHGTLVLHGSLVPDLPPPLDKPVDLGDIEVAVPETAQALAFGAVEASGATDATAGGACGAPVGPTGGGGGDAGGDGASGDGGTPANDGGDGGASDVVANYPLDASGIDVGPYNASLTGFGVPTSATDRFAQFGGAIHLDGSSQYLTHTSFTQLPVGSASRTLCVWERTTSTSSTFMSIVDWGTANQQQRFGLSIANANGGTAIFTGQKADVTGASGVSDGTWHHLCATFDTSTGLLSLYVDARPPAQQPLTLDTKGQDLVVGRKVTSNDEYFSGDLDDLRIYSRALSATGVSTLYHDKGYAP